MHGWIAALLDLLGMGAGSAAQTPGKVAGRWRCPPGARRWVAPAGRRKWLAPPGRRVWRVDPMATFAGRIDKTPGARLWLAFSFGDHPEIRAGATIASFTITQTNPPDAALSITGEAPEANGYEVAAWFDGGTDAKDYDVKCSVTFSTGAKDAKTGTLEVRTKSE